jgi:glycosyltransferase involved in cell wall biosynthesis
MMLDVITPLILTYNEAPNIGRTLSQLTWAKRIVVVDSFSTDETTDILRSYPQVQIYQRRFDTAANQDNFGLDQVTSEWVLSLDADYLLTDELVGEIQNLTPSDSINAYWARFKYCIFGKPLRGTLYPPRKVLYRHQKARYYDDGHTQRVRVDGDTAWLSAFILHDDRKPLSRWLGSQDRYMLREVEKLRQTPHNQLSRSDQLRRNKIFAPFVVLFYCLVLKKCILDGWRGWYYALQRALAETLLAIRLIEEEKLGSDFAAPVRYQLPTETLQDRPLATLKDSK